jgi:hypothetical protein
VPRADLIDFFAAYSPATGQLVVAAVPRTQCESECPAMFISYRPGEAAFERDLFEDFAPLLPLKTPPLTVEVAGVILNENGESGLLMFACATQHMLLYGPKQFVVVFDSESLRPIRTLLVPWVQTQSLVHWFVPLYFEGTTIGICVPHACHRQLAFGFIRAEIEDEGLSVRDGGTCVTDEYLDKTRESSSICKNGFFSVACLGANRRLLILNRKRGDGRLHVCDPQDEARYPFTADDFVRLLVHAVARFGLFEVWGATTKFTPIEYASCCVRDASALEKFRAYEQTNGVTFSVRVDDGSYQTPVSSVLLKLFSVPEVVISRPLRARDAASAVLRREVEFWVHPLLEAATKMNTYVASVISVDGAALASGLTGAEFAARDGTATVGVTFVPLFDEIDNETITSLINVVGLLFVARDPLAQAIAFIGAVATSNTVVVDTPDIALFWSQVKMCCDLICENFGVIFSISHVTVILAGDQEADLELADVPESSALHTLQQSCRFIFIPHEELSAESVASVEGCLDARENAHLTNDAILGMRKAVALFGAHFDLPHGLVTALNERMAEARKAGGAEEQED